MKRLLLFTITLFTFTQSQAQGWGQTQKIVPNDRFLEQQFGHAVAIEGDYAVIGMDNNLSNDLAGAYVFKNDGNGNWVQLQKLGNPDYDQFDKPGFAVAISGDYIFVGDPLEDYNEMGTSFFSNEGAVYIFKNDGSDNWNFNQKIVASDREEVGNSDGNQFGTSIAISGNYAAIGIARQDTDTGGNDLIDAGAVYLFEFDGTSWNEVQKIEASDRETFDYFGRYSLSIDGDVLIVGAHFEDDDASDSNNLSGAGSAYIFERDGTGTWNEVQKIVASDREQGEWFGFSVALDGDDLVVGASKEYLTGNTSAQYGAVYVYERDGSGVWIEVQKITSNYLEYESKFGHSVSIDGDNIIVGGYRVDLGGTLDGGAAFMFAKDGLGVWNEVAVMYDVNANTSDNFGFNVAISGENTIVGAYREDEDETEMNTIFQAGSAYIFNINEPNTLDPLKTLSVVENNFDTTIKAYPNPVINNLNIDFERFYDNVAITITNVLGRKVFFQNYQNIKSLELPFNTSKGLYLVEVKLDDQNTSVLKIIKH